MNKNELIDFLRDPHTLNAGDLKEIENIVQVYPYFQSARMLLAKGSKELKHPRTKVRVGSAAVYSTDRPLLKKYLSGRLIFLTKPAASPSNAESISYGAKKPSSGKGAGKLVIPSVPAPGSLDEILDDLRHEMEKLHSSRVKFKALQEQIEEDDAVTAALFKAGTTREEPAKEKKTVSVSKPKFVTKTGSLAKKTKPVVKEKKEIRAKSKAVPPLKKAAYTSKRAVAEPKKTTKNPSSTSTTPSTTKKEDDKEGPAKSTDEIIAKFIEGSPSISKLAPNHETDEDLSDDSSQWNDDLVSEHLAEIYLRQGHKQRAIKIYNALSLKFPQKKSYFADLISKIKQCTD